MARIELRDCTIRFKDGLAGTAKLTSSPPSSGVTSMAVGTVALNTADTDQIPVGARFTVAQETSPQTHVVLTRTPGSGATTSVTFSPALGAGTYAENGGVTFAPQELEIKIGDGNITYTEHKEYQYLLDRGDLDTVREGNEVPMDVKLDCVYEHITTGTSETISPMDAIKGVGSASEWVSSSADLCEPYSIDLEVEHEPNCGVAQNENTLFPDFRPDTKEVNFKDATISVSGKCNATEPVVSRT